jgi:glycosyltransferase involved in cell wall biosynthesis
VNVVIGLTKLNDRTGSEVYCLGLVEALRAAGHEVEVFALYSSPEARVELERLGGRLCTYPRALSLVPDRVVCMHPLATALLLRRVGREVPALAVVHGVIPGEAPVRASRIDRFVAVSPFVADHLVETEGLLREDIAVIPNGIDLNRFAAPPTNGPSQPVRVLWASTYLPLRHDALVALAHGVLDSGSAELTVVDDRLPSGLLPESDRIRVIPKGREITDLIGDHDVVAGLGPGRILLEALAMNRAALSLNIDGLGEYMDSANLVRLEYYRERWGGPVARLLDPAVVRANQNRRGVAEAHYDAAVNVAKVVEELEALSRRRQAPLRYRLTTVRRLPGLARDYALIPWLKRRLRIAPLRPVLGR